MQETMLSSGRGWARTAYMKRKEPKNDCTEFRVIMAVYGHERHIRKETEPRNDRTGFHLAMAAYRQNGKPWGRFFAIFGFVACQFSTLTSSVLDETMSWSDREQTRRRRRGGRNDWARCLYIIHFGSRRVI